MLLYCEKLKNNDGYRNFYQNKIAVSMCGTEKEDIVQVEIFETKKDNPGYWAYLDLETGDFHYIFKSEIQVMMCSPDFFKRDIQSGKGKIVKVTIQEKVNAVTK